MYGYIEAMIALWQWRQLLSDIEVKHDRMQATTWYWSFCM